MRFIQLIILIFLCQLALAQKSIPGTEVYCPFDFDRTYYERIPAKGNNNQRRNGSVESTSNMVVIYNGFTEEAKIAFQYAVDIWSRLLKSETPILINAYFISFEEPTIIGSAAPGSTAHWRVPIRTGLRTERTRRRKVSS